ncbi:uncharacterized protein B0P05DRAFT_556604 [Gilbertella persicaria]|uniref:uncharacterized protein n=1 Tax=Gilbertella persicaria TaxID=101096 RepID=UPI00221FB184|nr:uncharacterized protein B0P05DRAFT_556604 [Gilbertella persicaria]KAI8062340.1 hypothetical protein B0P05DRAFT_556604 [Gilbertella persicaria]
MVSFSNILLAGLALMIGASAAPNTDAHTLQKRAEFDMIVKSNLALKPRACEDNCCRTVIACCIFYGGSWSNGKCNF